MRPHAGEEGIASVIEKTVAVEQSEEAPSREWSGSGSSPTNRVVAWALVAVTAVLACTGVALALVAAQNPVLADDWESRLYLAGIGAAAALLFGVVGLLIARAEPRNAIAWIFLGTGTLLSWEVAGFGYVDLARARDDAWPAADWVEWLATLCFIPALFVAPALVAQLFPGGRPLPGRWRWALWASIAVAAVSTVAWPFDPETLDPERRPFGVPDPIEHLAGALNFGSATVLAPAVFIASVAALLARFRGSRGIERQQMKWLAFAGAVVGSAFVLLLVLGSLGADSLAAPFLAGVATLALIPVAVAVAILRYRLYDIDRVISKTLVYGSLTVVLGAAYAALVLAGQSLFSSFAGGGDLAIAVSTLVVAALFLPLRSRLQRLVDRRFYRRRYDAERTLGEFATRLRERVDLDGLGLDLISVVRETVQPAHVSLWLRSDRREHRVGKPS